MCISNIQRPLASERPMCPVLLIRPFDTQFRMWTQMVHQASLSANFKSPKGTVGRVLHQQPPGWNTFQWADLCTQSRATLSFIWLGNTSGQRSSGAKICSICLITWLTWSITPPNRPSSMRVFSANRSFFFSLQLTLSGLSFVTLLWLTRVICPSAWCQTISSVLCSVFSKC